MTSYSSASSTPSGGRGISSNVILLALAGLFALLLAQQIAAGWLALGERINIPRTDFNLTEILVMVIAGVWGLFTLFSALTLPDRDTAHSPCQIVIRVFAPSLTITAPCLPACAISR